MHQKLFENWLLLLTLCVLDTSSSVILFSAGLAVEANPLLRPFADMGMVPFVSAKALTFWPPLCAAYWFGKHYPGYVASRLRLASIGYVAIYFGATLLQVGGL